MFSKQLFAKKLSIPKLKELLIPWTVNVRRLVNNKFHRQMNGMAMGSPLGLLLGHLQLNSKMISLLSLIYKTCSHNLFQNLRNLEFR